MNLANIDLDLDSEGETQALALASSPASTEEKTSEVLDSLNLDLDLDFSDLDKELDRQFAIHDAQLAAMSAKARLRSGAKLLDAERAKLKAIILEWELRVEWDPVACASLWLVHSCTCGSITETYAGLLEKQQHRKRENDTRWIKVPAVRAGLPSEVLFQRTPVPMCPSCAAGKGWNLDKAVTIHEVRIDRPESIINLE
jgi:hypothetical protein